MRLSHIKKIIILEHMEDLWLHLRSDIHTNHLTVFYCGIGVVVEWIVYENSTNTITKAEEQIALVTKMLVSTAGPGASQEFYTPQHIPWTPLSSWNCYSKSSCFSVRNLMFWIIIQGIQYLYCLLLQTAKQRMVRSTYLCPLVVVTQHLEGCWCSM